MVKNILWSWTCVVLGGGLHGLCGGLYRHHLQGDMLVRRESSSRRSCRCGRSHHIWQRSRCKNTYIQQDKGMEQKTQNDSRTTDTWLWLWLWLYLTTLQVQEHIHTTRQRHGTKDTNNRHMTMTMTMTVFDNTPGARTHTYNKTKA